MNSIEETQEYTKKLMQHYSKADDTIILEHFNKISYYTKDNTPTEEISEANEELIELESTLLDFRIFPIYFETRAWLSLALKKESDVSFFCRSLEETICMLLEAQKNDPNSKELEKVLNQRVAALKEAQEYFGMPYEMHGSCSELLKYYLTDDMIKAEKELMTRLTMRLGGISRKEAEESIKQVRD